MAESSIPPDVESQFDAIRSVITDEKLDQAARIMREALENPKYALCFWGIDGCYYCMDGTGKKVQIACVV
jgi:hypothetical protein